MSRLVALQVDPRVVWHLGVVWLPRGVLVSRLRDGRAQAVPADPVPLVGVFRKVGAQHLAALRFEIWTAQHAANLGDIRVGADELNLTQAQRSEARALGKDQRRDCDDAVIGVPHDAHAQLIAHAAVVFAQVLPPGDGPLPGLKWELCAGACLERQPRGLETQQAFQ